MVGYQLPPQHPRSLNMFGITLFFQDLQNTDRKKNEEKKKNSLKRENKNKY